MQREIIVKGRTLGGSSDLTLLAPIKQGFVDSLESITYKTRTKLVLDLLHSGRKSLHEYSWAQLISDSVERVGAIQSVRVAMLEPDDKVLLAVTFDGSRESYIRVLWEKVGTLLDLVFCGTTDYVTAWDHSFDEWMAWGRRVQVEAAFFYGPAEFSARDCFYERRISRMRERGIAPNLKDAQLNELGAVLPSTEEIANHLLSPLPYPPADEPPVLESLFVRMPRELARSGLEGLASLYTLTETHRPGTRDGDILRRATIDLLREFVVLRNRFDGTIDHYLTEAASRIPRQLAWLFPGPGEPVENVRKRPPPPQKRPDPGTDPDIQGGILRSYPGVTHGVLLLLNFTNAASAKACLDWIVSNVTRDSDSTVGPPGKPFVNVGYTLAGLRAAGVDEEDLALFPEEYRQGMSARAGSLGDTGNNHPLRWRLPRRLKTLTEPPAGPAVELEAVHAIVQLRCADQAHAQIYELRDPQHPLHSYVKTLIAGLPDGTVLAAQDLVSRSDIRWGTGFPVDAFGYAVGMGQPDLAKRTPPFDFNRILLGEVVLGHDNVSDFAVDPSDPALPAKVRERERWLHNGSFLVIRKYREFVDWLDSTVTTTAAAMAKELGEPPSAYVEVVYAKLMGRQRDGRPLVDVNAHYLNFFTYKDDQQGALCPLHAHIRRANPRENPRTSVRLPRLVRRGMSYGPPVGVGGPQSERGVVFMAYNASLGEQYEVVQRWLVAGNSTGSTSGQSCPIVGVAQGGLARYFSFEHSGKVFSVKLDDATFAFNEPLSPTRLEWGIYLFAPSLSTLGRLQRLAAEAAAVAPATNSAVWSLQRGRCLLTALKLLELEKGTEAAAVAWKAAIEDPDSIDRLDSAALFAAIRQDHAGLLRTPYGVLVCDRGLLHSMLLDPNGRYSSSGQLRRMRRSFGEIPLGLDAGEIYRQQSGPINAEIEKLGEQGTFDLAFQAATQKIDAILKDAVQQSLDVKDPAYEVFFDAREVLNEVVAVLSEVWFGLQDDPGKRFARGPTDWSWKRGEPPLYPGHFTAISRYMFQPNPGPTVVSFGEDYGQALREAMRLFVTDHRASGSKPQSPTGGDAVLASAAFNHPLGTNDDDFVARTMVGVLMGLIPTIIGATLSVLTEWFRDGTFGPLRARLDGRLGYLAASQTIRAAMDAAAQARPRPQLAWRTVKCPHRLSADGGASVNLEVGDKIIFALVSGTQQSLADGQPDGRLMFGGVRDSQKAHPTHACPGYAAGIGAMLGTLAAMLTRREHISSGGAAHVFQIRGSSGVVAPAPMLGGFIRTIAARRGAKRILAWGDSWLDNPYLGYPTTSDLCRQLRKSVSIDTKLASYWTYGTAQSMAAQTNDFLDEFGNASAPFDAILLSAGGNDSTGDVLQALIEPKGSATVINLPALRAHIDRIRGNYLKIVAAIRGATQIPIIVHGYDYPIPRGLPIGTFLLRPFTCNNYDPQRDLALIVGGMRTLIDALNTMLAKLSDVSYVKLTGTISGHWPGQEVAHWFDDLHPKADAFELMANSILKTINSSVRAVRRRGILQRAGHGLQRTSPSR
jgi:hypothetical protein